jgi:hypothetical protein
MARAVSVYYSNSCHTVLKIVALFWHRFLLGEGGGKGSRCVGLTTSRSPFAELLKFVWAPASWSPNLLSRPVMGLLFFFFALIRVILVFSHFGFFCNRQTYKITVLKNTGRRNTLVWDAIISAVTLYTFLGWTVKPKEICPRATSLLYQNVAMPMSLAP